MQQIGSKPLNLFIRFTSSRLHSRLIHTPQTVSFDNSEDVYAICNCFRKGWSWDIISTKFCSFALSDSFVERVLLEFKDPIEAKRGLGFFHWSAKRKNFHHGIRSYCIAIHVLVKARLLNDARALLESILDRTEMEGSDSRFSVADALIESYGVSDSHPLVFDLLVQGYAKRRMVGLAFEVCVYLEEHGFNVSLISLNTILHVAQRSGECGLVWDVYEHMILRRNYPNAASFRIMIDALCKEGKLQTNVDEVVRIMGKRSSSPSVIVNSSLILRVIEGGKMEETMVVVLLKRLLQKNLIPDSVAYTLIVHARVTLGSLDSAREMYSEMVRRGFEANSFVYTSFIGACCREGRIDEAGDLLQEMEERGLKPYGKTFDHLIMGFANSDRLDESFGACEKILRAGLVPSCSSFNMMVGKLSVKGDVEKANTMLTVLLDKGFLPDEVTYSHLIKGYAKKEKIQEVLKLYYEMEYRSMSPGLSVFVTIIQSLCHCGKLEDALKYLRIMKVRSLTPTVTIYETLIAGYMEKGDSTMALNLRNEMASLLL